MRACPNCNLSSDIWVTTCGRCGFQIPLKTHELRSSIEYMEHIKTRFQEIYKLLGLKVDDVNMNDIASLDLDDIQRVTFEQEFRDMGGTRTRRIPIIYLTLGDAEIQHRETRIPILKDRIQSKRQEIKDLQEKIEQATREIEAYEAEIST